MGNDQQSCEVASENGPSLVASLAETLLMGATYLYQDDEIFLGEQLFTAAMAIWRKYGFSYEAYNEARVLAAAAREKAIIRRDEQAIATENAARPISNRPGGANHLG